MYPTVRGEVETLRRVLAGASLARYGDGEFNLCAGASIPCQRFVPSLGRRLRGILHESGACMVGIPNLWEVLDRRPGRVLAPQPKVDFWRKYLDTAPRFLGARPYASAFVTRPDSAPWIDTVEYWEMLVSLWAGRDVTLVYGGGRSLTPADLTGATRVDAVRAPRIDAWGAYDALLAKIGTPTRALLCLGPTATVLAVDLAAKGVHAVDLGHVGMFLRKVRAGEPRVVTAADRVAV